MFVDGFECLQIALNVNFQHFSVKISLLVKASMHTGEKRKQKYFKRFERTLQPTSVDNAHNKTEILIERRRVQTIRERTRASSERCRQSA